MVGSWTEVKGGRFMVVGWRWKEYILLCPERCTAIGQEAKRLTGLKI